MIGIDLGTTFSCVGVWKNNRVEIIPEDTGRRTTPSYVAFSKEEDKPLVGYSAKNYARIDPESTLFDAKRMIGRRFNDPAVQRDMQHWPFRVTNMDDRPYLQLMHRGCLKSLAPEEVSTYVLKKMKQSAEDFVGCPVKDAVITCPAYFNNAQREATKRAGISAGLNVLRIINEPTAAALAYGLDLKGSLEGRRRNVLIFDFGGGTFDVSLVVLDGDEFRAVTVDGDTHLGGEDLNNILVEHFAQLFKEETGRDIMADSRSSNPEVRKRARRALYRLRILCESAKCELSSSYETDIDFNYAGENYSGTITRSEFEQLCMSTFRRCIDILERLLANALMRRSDIDDVVLVGGSTRIPKVQSMVSDFFGGKRLRHNVDPDEAVAWGATIQAAIITGRMKYVVGDIAPHSLGISCREDGEDDVMSVIIRRSSSLPCKERHMYTTTYDKQRVVSIQVYEGEDSTASRNNLLGKFDLCGIPPAPAGEPEIQVTFEIDADGILHVTAKDLGSGSRNRITIKRT